MQSRDIIATISWVFLSGDNYPQCIQYFIQSTNDTVIYMVQISEIHLPYYYFGGISKYPRDYFQTAVQFLRGTAGPAQ